MTVNTSVDILDSPNLCTNLACIIIGIACIYNCGTLGSMAVKLQNIFCGSRYAIFDIKAWLKFILNALVKLELIHLETLF